MVRFIIAFQSVNYLYFMLNIDYDTDLVEILTIISIFVVCCVFKVDLSLHYKGNKSVKSLFQVA